MGKWLARLKAETEKGPREGTDKTDETHSEQPEEGVLSVLTVRQEGEFYELEPANDSAPEFPRAGRGNPYVTPERLTQCANWTAEEIETFQGRSLHFWRGGVSEARAEHLAEWLVIRDRESDDRRLCVECAGLRRGHCDNWRAAGFVARIPVPLDVLCRCGGFQPALKTINGNQTEECAEVPA